MCASLGRRPYQRTIRWVWAHNQYLKVKCGVSNQSRREAMEIRARSHKSMKDKDVESCIYNKMFRAWIPQYLKISRCGILDLYSRLGRGVLKLLRHRDACNRGVKSLFSGRKIRLMGSSGMNFLNKTSFLTILEWLSNNIKSCLTSQAWISKNIKSHFTNLKSSIVEGKSLNLSLINPNSSISI